MIPALFDVDHLVFDASGEDAHGNPTAGWKPAVTKKFVTWANYSTSEPKVAGHDRDVVDAGILVYPTDGNVPSGQRWFGDVPKPGDRMVIDGREFEVVGQPERADKAWFNTPILNWCINLKAVSG